MTTSTIQGIPVDPTPPANGEGLIFNGTVYVPTPANPGDITAVNTNLPLTGGGVSGALTLDINNFTGDAGAGGLDGAVPAPAAGDAAAGKFLKADGTWAAPGGGGLGLLASVRDNNYLTTNSMVAVNMLVTGVFASAGGDLLIQVDTNLSLAGGLTTETARLDLFVDAVQVGGKYIGSNGTLGSPLNWPVSITLIATGIAAGNHTVTVKWASGVGGNIGTAGGADSPNVLYVWEIL